MTVLTYILLTFLIVCAIAACLSKKLLASVVIFMSFSVIMSMIWMILESPDLAITETAVGVGTTSILFFVTLKKIGKIDEKSDGKEQSDEQSER